MGGCDEGGGEEEERSKGHVLCFSVRTLGESKRDAVLQIPSKWKGRFHQVREQGTSPSSAQGQPEDCAMGMFINTRLPLSGGSCLSKLWLRMEDQIQSELGTYCH